MENNDILRRLRYILDYNDSKMMKTFDAADFKVSIADLGIWLNSDDDDALEIQDVQLAAFLNGLINDKRGKKDGPQPEPEKSLNNNQVLRKLKIALNLKDDEMIAILGLADFRFSKHELSAFFRKPGQRQYRECKDQVLRNFLVGMQIKYRVG